MAFLLHQLLSESASRYPQNEAVIYKDRSVTYQELEKTSNRLAHTLISLGIKKGDRVGLYMDRGIEAITAACGVLKTGSAYVPIDPTSPLRRMTYIIEKCRITSLVTVHEKLPKIEQAYPDGSPLQQIILMNGSDPAFTGRLGETRLVDGFSSPEDQLPDVNAIETDIAYILFTSGSTGNPKGVMLSHHNSMAFIDSSCGFFKIEKEDRLSNIAPLHFDMSIFDIFVAFKAGACVVVVPETTAIFPGKLAEYISQKRISVWNSVPSALSLLATVKNLNSFDFSNLRLILFAGELFPLKYLRILFETISHARFCNMYGQTEANSSTYYWIDELPADGLLPIGKALPNFEVFAMDDQGGQIQAPGQEGELYVRASTVAQGYWGEPEKTEAAFVRNPLEPIRGEKVYKTGDLVRLDWQQNFVFLGRKDHMIKSRGYRIEIGEIETVLCNHPEIKNAVVIPIPDELIGNRLSALVVPFTPGKVTQEELFQYCIAQLPKYMVPEIIEFREALPTTSSGKVDRQKLKGEQS